MSESEKPEGDLEDAEGVTTDSEGRPTLMMEVLQKGGNSDSDSDDGLIQKSETDE